MSPEDLSYIINELGEDRSQYFNSIAPPLMQSSNFAFPTVAAMKEAFKDEMGGYIYSRGLNPTSDILRKKLAAMDGAEDCLVFANGAAAIFAGVLANVKAGDHLISVRDPYSWAKKMFDVILPRFGVSTTYVDGRDFENFKKAIQSNTSFIYLESPNSWTFELQDIRAVADLARKHKIVTLIDNSYCTPIYQQTIPLGIDLSMQTATKYIGGHSDTLGGVLSGTSEMIRKIFNSEYLNIGSGISPFNAWLLLRGLRTLPMRLEKITATTRSVISFLQEHPAIEKLIFPLDPAFPQYELAQMQMTGACGLFTIVLKQSTEQKIIQFCESLKTFLMAVSWGGHESLVIPKCAGLAEGEYDPLNESHQYIRLYTGLEDAEYLKNDINLALNEL